MTQSTTHLDTLLERPIRPCAALIAPFLSRYHQAPFPMCFTPRALKSIVRTVGTYHPETGGILFGPTDKMGIDLFEFDHDGSKRAGAAVYAPDAKWGMTRVNHHLFQTAPRVWWGNIHSHPGSYGEPSPAVGDGLGDLGYAAKVFEENEILQWYLMPIVTQTRDQVFISPFIIHRDYPDEPFIASELNICSTEEFPDAEFNPAFLKRIEEKVPPPLEHETFEETAIIVCPYWSPARRRRYWDRVERRRNAYR